MTVWLLCCSKTLLVFLVEKMADQWQLVRPNQKLNLMATQLGCKI